MADKQMQYAASAFAHPKSDWNTLVPRSFSGWLKKNIKRLHWEHCVWLPWQSARRGMEGSLGGAGHHPVPLLVCVFHFPAATIEHLHLNMSGIVLRMMHSWLLWTSIAHIIRLITYSSCLSHTGRFLENKNKYWTLEFVLYWCNSTLGDLDDWGSTQMLK